MEAALDIERAEGSEVDSLLADIQRSEPRLYKRVLQIRDQYRQLTHQLRELCTLTDKAADDDVDVADLRRRLDQLATEVRYQRAREADLIYEAYLVDLGSGD
jgi:small-conductance mechanosensitive channel